jgi:hypothetical protein
VTRSISKFIMGSSATAVFMVTLALPGPALAQSRGFGARLGAIQHQQQMQIRKGLQNGDLSKQQAARLEKGEKTIQATEARDKAKGPLTGAEATQLHRETQRETAAIKQADSGSYTKPPSH